jgi:serine protease
MAPGVSILSTTPLGSFYYKFLLGIPSNYGSLSGTSMATAHASGAAALLATRPEFDSADAIYQALEASALDLEAAGRDDQTGYGSSRSRTRWLSARPPRRHRPSRRSFLTTFSTASPAGTWSR